MDFEIKPPIAVVAFRWCVNAFAIAGLICLMGYIIPWVVFWAVHTLIPAITIEMRPMTVVALWALIFVLGFMDTLLLTLVKKK